MINKLEYNFSVITDGFSGEERPYIEMVTYPDQLPEECIIDLEINQIHFDDLWSIVSKLEKIIDGQEDKCKFGYETTFISVYKKGFRNHVVDFPDGKVFIDYNYGKSELETDLTIDDILKMMTDYRDFVDAWEKETGKVKK